MKKSVLFLAGVLVSALCGCSAATQSDTKEETTKEETTKEDVTTAVTTAASTAETSATEAAEEQTEKTTEYTVKLPEEIHIGSLKGPTTMGLVNAMYDTELFGTDCTADYTIATQADELVTGIVKGELDIALVPANVASVLYNKTEGGVSVIDINTLGVLYVVENGSAVGSVEDLKGRTIYVTGKGTTPDYVLQYLLNQHGLTVDDVDIEYESEATAIVTRMTENTDCLGLLPQPFVTTALMKNESLRIALDMTQEWDKVSDSSLVTGVTIVRNEFLDEYPDAVDLFLSGHEASVKALADDPETTAARVEEQGIVAAGVAKKAFDYCNICCITGNEMKADLEGYLGILYSFSAESVGGALPASNFYYGAN